MNEIVLDVNKIVKVVDIRKSYLQSDLYKVEFIMIQINHFLRRDSKPFEAYAEKYAMYIPAPSNMTVAEQRKYIQECWGDYIKDALKMWGRYKHEDDMWNDTLVESSDTRIVEKYKVYHMKDLSQKAFSNLWKLFRYLVMIYDIKPSELKFTSCSGYEKEATKIEYSYEKFKEDFKQKDDE